ncbi:hypothetical protein Mal15_56630 [Stieleria maiorica]|uniref:DUF1446 domain-containing protein n=1 Tax=Stieleria maiorica TaxID=2795974 RepID=A0A5B9MPI4_9BACT|nr:acyclic terpene utilization AtuA family protein [Stieleria maiorica]QEG01586.1 hypothetical protein Mal15_56630 [Stieleria maiorica]
MRDPVRIGNAHGFWGDRIEAAAEMLASEPELDFITLDFLAEVSLSIMAAQRERDPQAGYADDFIQVLETLVPYFQQGGRCRMVTNAGGLNPLGCAIASQRLLQRTNCPEKKIAVIAGDDVMTLLTCDSNREQLRNLDTRQSIDAVEEHLLTANAYIGASPIAQALSRGADLVIAGRVADPSLTVGPCLAHFGWDPDDYNRIAGATVAGHLIECGTQVTGGISTDWLRVPESSRIGFPIAEVSQDGTCVITKPNGSGGWVNESTVKEQLLYEIGDPDAYLSPDAIVSLKSVQVRQIGADRVCISGARGLPPPPNLKVSATYHAGYWAAAQLSIIGQQAHEKACRAGAGVLQRLADAGLTFQNSCVDVIGSHEFSEVVMRLAVADRSRNHVERFCRSVMPLITAGPPGTTGYAFGRPKVHSLIRYWPCLIARDQLEIEVSFLPQSDTDTAEGPPPSPARPSATAAVRSSPDVTTSTREATGRLVDVALARSGDKGINANLGVIARRPGDYPQLESWLTAARVAEHFGVDPLTVRRFEMPNLDALNFVLSGMLLNPIALDAQGKALGQKLLQIPLPEAWT